MAVKSKVVSILQWIGAALFLIGSVVAGIAIYHKTTYKKGFIEDEESCKWVKHPTKKKTLLVVPQDNSQEMIEVPISPDLEVKDIVKVGVKSEEVIVQVTSSPVEL